MKARISTFMRVSEERMWDELQKVSSLMKVASPILTFKPYEGHAIPDAWSPGIEYKFRIYFFGIVPLGDHFIKLKEVNNDKKMIVSNEHGRLTSVWNHVIKLKAVDSNRIEYTDEIEIKAGILTVAIWLFAHVFYRHRQANWKKLLGG